MNIAINGNQNRVQVPVLERPETAKSAAPGKNNVRLGVLAVLFVVISSIFVLSQLSPPRPLGTNAPATDFSSGRAMENLRVIAQRPHPIGSLEHAAVRTFLVQQLTALGLQTEVQTADVLPSKRTNALRAVTINNVIGFLKGSGNGGALLLSAHYDTVPDSPGASDDGAGVATLLETARALKIGPPLKNDLIFLFSDGEESGLLGAKAFVQQHLLAKRVALALNFEARGSGGPVVLFETSEHNAWLISEFAKAAPYPTGNSLAYEIYRLMPNSTDMNVFKQSGIRGLNFAYFDSVASYHSPADNLENISEASLQHHGTYALALARHFGNVSLDTPGSTNAVYFDLLGRWLVHYPMSWVLPATVLITILFVAVTWFGCKQNRITLRGMVHGFFSFIISTAVAAAVALTGWGLIVTVSSAHPRSIYLGAFVMLVAAIAALFYDRFLRKATVDNLAMGALGWWLLLLVAVSLLVPGGSYLFFWPLLFSLAARLIVFAATTTPRDSVKTLALQSVLALPGIALLVPLIYQIFSALGFFAVSIVVPMLMLLFGLLIPHFALMRARHDVG